MDGYNALIALDMDGTALDDEKKVTGYTLRAIVRAMEKGCLVLPVTGRPVAGLPAPFMSIPGIDHAITANGSCIYRIDDYSSERWECIRKISLPAQTVRLIADIGKRHDIMVDCFIDGVGHIEKRFFPVIPTLGYPKGIADYMLLTKRFVDDIYEVIDGNVEQIEKITLNFRNDEEGLALREEVKKELAHVRGISVVAGGGQNLEIGEYTATKGNAVKWLCGLYGIAHENTMACGDQMNDIDMIESVSFGVAMGNAPAHVKTAAKRTVADLDHGGCAQAIRMLLEG